MQTRGQERAQDAFDRVEARKTRSKEYRDKYTSMAHGLGALIRTAGLAQSLAFVDSRGEPPHQDLLNDLAQTVGKSTSNALLEASRKQPLLDYMRLTREVLAACQWYKRFAESVLEDKPRQAGDASPNTGPVEMQREGRGM